MHLSGALYVGRNSRPGKKVDKAEPKPNFGKSSHVTVSEQNNGSDGSAQPPPLYPGHATSSYMPPGGSVPLRGRHKSTARASEPSVPASLNGILENDDKLFPWRESEPISKPTNPSSARKESSPRATSVVMGRGRSQSIGELSGVHSEIVRTGSTSPRRSSLFSPDPALADDEDDVSGR